jgi:4-diphosphocytidyl-2-C-methyl-D-erythritol kinase
MQNDMPNNYPYFKEGYPTFLAPAKLNLFLHITSQREDGYHNLQTIFQLLKYGDELQFIPRKDNQFISQYKVAGISTKDDLILRAANSLYQYALEADLIIKDKDYGVDIYLSKKLPMGGGLGGGSSDAATTLKVLNHIWNINLDYKTLSQIGLKLGADVPIFILGRNCWAEGVGELLSPMTLPEKYYVVLIPNVHISTAKLFTAANLKRNCNKIDRLSLASNHLDKNFDKFIAKTENIFEPLVRKGYPEIESAFTALAEYGKPRLTGTGACLFINLKTQQQCIDIVKELENKFAVFYAKGRTD